MRIEQSAFERCRLLKIIRLPKHLNYIGKRCFWGCDLEKVYLPPGIVEIREQAFYNNMLT